MKISVPRQDADIATKLWLKSGRGTEMAAMSLLLRAAS